MSTDPAGKRTPSRSALEPFTARERDVVALLDQGFPTKRIAAQLSISPWTVQDHLQSMYAKAGVSSRAELVALLRGRLAASG